MIELTREEALNILKSLHVIEGAILQGELKGDIGFFLDYPCEILTEKLSGEKLRLRNEYE